MNCKKNTTQNKHESGSTTVEALMAVVILFMIAFAMIQVYHWCMTKQFCQYSAFYTSKSLALGYQEDVALRAARVAAIAISGSSVGTGDDDEYSAENYMVYGDGSGVSYQYWHPRGYKPPSLSVYGSVRDGRDYVKGHVVFRNAPLVEPALAKLFSITSPPEASATVSAHDYSKELLE